VGRKVECFGKKDREAKFLAKALTMPIKNEIEASVNLLITTNKQHIDMECYKHGEISNLPF
jgi:hypothetical protein